MQFEDFLRPVTKAVTAHFNIATAVGRHMARRGHGVILVMAGGREAIPRLGGSHVAWAGSPDSAASSPPSSDRTARASRGCSHQAHPATTTTISSTATSHGENEAPPAPGTEGLLVRHQPSYDEVANIATFAAYDRARTLTASEINCTGGAVID
jgi:hypothetical protein